MALRTSCLAAPGMPKPWATHRRGRSSRSGTRLPAGPCVSMAGRPAGVTEGRAVVSSRRFARARKLIPYSSRATLPAAVQPWALQLPTKRPQRVLQPGGRVSGPGISTQAARAGRSTGRRKPRGTAGRAAAAFEVGLPGRRPWGWPGPPRPCRRRSRCDGRTGRWPGAGANPPDSETAWLRVHARLVRCDHEHGAETQRGRAKSRFGGTLRVAWAQETSFRAAAGGPRSVHCRWLNQSGRQGPTRALGRVGVSPTALSAPTQSVDR